MHIVPILLAMMGTPFKQVSKPINEAFARFKRGRERFRVIKPDPNGPSFIVLKSGKRLAIPAGGAGGAPPAATESKATQLREKAAAKFKEAHDYIEECATELKTTVDALNTGETELPAEMLTKFEGVMKEARELASQHTVAAQQEGSFEGLRESMEYYYGKATGKSMPWNQVHIQEIDRPKSLGSQFVESDTYKELIEGKALSSEQHQFKTEPITEEKAATDLIGTYPSGPGAALVLPQYLPGILGLPQRPLTVRELFSQAPTNSDLISYARQTGFDNAAAAVAQATSTTGPANSVKPQSSIKWERQTSPVETIATWFAATRQQLADAGQVQALIDNQGRLMLQLEEEDQLMDGDGTSPNLRGLMNTTGVQTLDVADTADNLDAIRTARRLVATGIARMRADGIVMNPVDSEEFDLLKDLNGQYRGGNPVGNFTFAQPLWGLRRVESEAVAPGTCLVGAFTAGATVYERQGITVYTADQHADFFIRNLIAILFEERLGLAVFYPAAFVKMTLNLTDWGT